MFHVKHLAIISFTPHTPHVECEAQPEAETSSAVGAPAREIEITPAIVRAGAELIWSYFYDVMIYGDESGRELALRVFQAMMSRLDPNKI